MIAKLNRIQIINIIAFLIVPFISSIISTIHIVSFFEIGNLSWMAYLLAVSFELGAISSALAITVLDKISKFAVWSIFLILIVFQVIGNVYYSFQYITYIELNNSEYLNTINEFLNFFYEFETPSDFKVFLCILIGSPIPLISLAFLKSLVDYLNGIVFGLTTEQSKELVEDVDQVVNSEITNTEEVIMSDDVELEINESEEQEDVVEIEDEIEQDVEQDVEQSSDIITTNDENIPLSKDDEIELLKRKLADKDNELNLAYDKVKEYSLHLFGNSKI